MKKVIDNLEEKAKQFAIECHKAINQKYDNGPYEKHLQDVVNVAKRYGHLIPENERDEVFAGCWVHDVPEDTGKTWNDVNEILGEVVAEYSFALQNEKGRTRKDRANEKYYTEMKAYKHAAFIKLCDRIANATYSKSSGSSMFKKYKSEHSSMMLYLYTGKYQEMWNELSNIFFNS
jgi:(p)ppGpp synthase/HD superfamily hydrolase